MASQPVGVHRTGVGHRHEVTVASPSPPAVYTIGHCTRSIDEFLSLLRGAGVRLLVDVRSFPGSRRHPQFGKDALAASLRSEGIAYEWKKELGGFRKPRRGSRHTALTSAGFRGYADHMDADEFRGALDWLIQTSTHTPTAVMCAESLWWKCHRRILADALVAAGCEVTHIMAGGRFDPHRLHQTARVEAGAPVYDVSPRQGQFIE
jgi:uncharacterized protein (DUF488 family)